MSRYQSTSRDARRSVSSQLGDIDRQIVAAIERHGGMTSAELEDYLSMKHQTVSAQITHLRDRGLLEDSGLKRRNANGRACIVWQKRVAAMAQTGLF